MISPVFWWSLAGIAVLVELLTGTFYLLMVAVGLSAGAVAAHLGLSQNVQLLSVSAIAVGATYCWHHFRTAHPGLRSSRDKNVEMDVGESVDIAAWDPNFTARVRYRGTVWTAELETASVNRGDTLPGPHQIVEMRGNSLIVRPRDPKHTPKQPWS
jgi:membrane protein implicated in regulation of membrane protease activity